MKTQGLLLVALFTFAGPVSAQLACPNSGLPVSQDPGCWARENAARQKQQFQSAPPPQPAGYWETTWGAIVGIKHSKVQQGRYQLPCVLLRLHQADLPPKLAHADAVFFLRVALFGVSERVDSAAGGLTSRRLRSVHSRSTQRAGLKALPAARTGITAG
ncbi:hypothetical protein [Lysobacter sp. CA199]|uniref:hypothetical protein n=1 Tax=Lysobacter sp. CA199 TaxID=3455608 RepID=UPI003F8D62DE